MATKRVASEHLGADVRRVVHSTDVQEFDKGGLHLLAEKGKAYGLPPGVGADSLIGDTVDARKVVDVHRCGLGSWLPQLFEKYVVAEHMLEALNRCDDLRVTSGRSNAAGELALESKRSSSEVDEETVP